MAAALGNRDPLFWTDKLHESLIKIPMANYKYTINEWIWTAKTIQDEMNIVTALDPFHYGLLLQVLALVPPRGIQYDSYIAELEANIQAYPADLIAKMDKFNNPNPGFLESIIETAKSIGLDINHDKRNKLGMKLDLKINNKEIILYDKEDYIYMSHGYLNLKGTKDLLTHLKLKRQILRSIGTKPFEIPIGDWKDLSSEERKDYLSPLLK